MKKFLFVAFVVLGVYGLKGILYYQINALMGKPTAQVQTDLELPAKAVTPAPVEMTIPEEPEEPFVPRRNIPVRVACGNQLAALDPTVRPLPGAMDEVIVINSNSPERIRTDGILVSTMTGRNVPRAHLNKSVQGRFNIFLDHINGSLEKAPMQIGVLLKNSGKEPASVELLDGSSYDTREAPFGKTPSFSISSNAKYFSGPGDRVMTDLLSGRKNRAWKRRFQIAGGQMTTLAVFRLPIGAQRCALLKLSTDVPLEVACVALIERNGKVIPWAQMLDSNTMAGPRDLAPGSGPWSIVYGRIGGVSIGSRWSAMLQDDDKPYLSLKSGQQIMYPLSSTYGKAMGMVEDQSAPMVARYGDTARRNAGNYGVEYAIKIPLANDTDETVATSVIFESPAAHEYGFQFMRLPDSKVVFRGNLKLQYKDENGQNQTRYAHIVHRHGEQGKPLVRLVLKPGEKRDVELNYLYPPDCTPPHLLTIATAVEDSDVPYITKESLSNISSSGRTTLYCR